MNRSPLECLRVAAGLTQQQMAARLKTSPASYQRYETGTMPIPAGVRSTVASMFQVAPELLNQPTTRRTVSALGRAMVHNMVRFGEMADPVKVWKRALAANGGDYVKARKSNPAAYKNYMEHAR